MHNNGDIDWNAVFNGMLLFAIIAGMARMTGRLLGESKPGKLLPQTTVTVVCPICGKVIEVPGYNCVTRSDALKRHIDAEHGLKAQTALLPQTAHDGPASRIADKWRRALKRNSALAFKDIEELRKTYGYDIDSCREALLDYRDIAREDYADSDDYREAKDEDWESFLDALDELAAEEEQPGSGLLSRTIHDAGEPVPYPYRYLSGWLSDPLPDYALLTLPSVVPEERTIDVVMKKLKDGVDTIQDSYQFRLFLNTMAKFHEYSIGNTILIMLQRPDASHVAGFHTWRQLERWVKAGEKGIAILAPVMPPRPTCSRCMGKLPKGSRYCPKCGADAPDSDLEDAPRFFKLVYVFDISQTDGKPLPEFDVPTLSGEINEAMFVSLLSLMRAKGVAVSFETRPYLSPSIKGQYTAGAIWVRPEEPRAQQLKTLLHEIAHHYSEGVFRIPRHDAETIAESAAYVVGAHYGFDTGVRSFPYVALWARDKAVLESNLGAIRKVATAMLNDVEKAA